MITFLKTITGKILVVGSFIGAVTTLGINYTEFKSFFFPEVYFNPQPLPPGPPLPQPLPIVEKIDINGIWYDETGGYFQIIQKEAIVSYVNYNSLGQKVGFGFGTLAGNDLKLNGFENSIVGSFAYQANLYLSNYQRNISGTVSIPTLGTSGPLNLTKN
jgi:hypothetical protein